MRILMVSMNSIHFQRWVSQLENSEHDIFWFDIKDGAKVSSLKWVTSFQGWRHKFPKLKGRTFIKKNFPKLNKSILENDVESAFKKVLQEVKPDVVHSFVLQISCLPILNIMNKNPQIKWVYSAWGSDLYNTKNKPNYKAEVYSILSKVDYLFTDCNRDFKIAKNNGFKGRFLGVFPGGGGYKIEDQNNHLVQKVEDRAIILVKGYQGELGRCIEVLKALKTLAKPLSIYKIVVFGTHEEVKTYIKQTNLKANLNITVLTQSSHLEILKLMGGAYIYIGNSMSDGMPNTLLEAVIMGAFPIQSNPGGATEDVIINNKNGLLIEKPTDVEHIAKLVKQAIINKELVAHAFQYNQTKIKPALAYSNIKEKVLKAYKSIS